MDQLSQSATEPCEFERLIVPEDENENTTYDDDEEEEDDEDSSYNVLLDPQKAFQGRVARAVSLCLYNKIHMAQVNWPETVNLTARRATCQLDESYQMGRLPISKSADIYPVDDTHKHLLETSSTVDDFERTYDGLIELDETRLNKLIETDLISSTV